jgi:hypothetical protein
VGARGDIVVTLGCLLVGCGAQVRSQEQPPFTPVHEVRCSALLSHARMIIKKYDADGDGTLDPREWQAAASDFEKSARANAVPFSSVEYDHMLREFDLVDGNRDGRIQPQELALGEGVSVSLKMCAKRGFKD